MLPRYRVPARHGDDAASRSKPSHREVVCLSSEKRRVDRCVTAGAIMRISRGQSRLALVTFTALSGVVAVNAFFLQDASVSSAAARARSERVKTQSDQDRKSRLALNGAEARASETAATSRIPQAASTEHAKVGRFAPTAAHVSPLSLPENADEATAEGTARAVQKILQERGYEPGRMDGAVGVVTRAAVMAYEHDNGLPLTAEATRSLLQHMRYGIPPETGAKAGRPGRMPHTEQIVRLVQQTLSGAGYFPGQLDGYYSKQLAEAIRLYESDIGLAPTGRISAPLVQWIIRPAASPSSGPVRKKTQ